MILLYCQKALGLSRFSEHQPGLALTVLKSHAVGLSKVENEGMAAMNTLETASSDAEA
jgi:hypothetical protein